MAQATVGVRQAIKGADLVDRLVELTGEVQGGLVGGDGQVKMASCLVDAAEAEVRLVLPVVVTDGPGQVEGLLVAVAGRVVPALFAVEAAEAGQGVDLYG